MTSRDIPTSTPAVGGHTAPAAGRRTVTHVPTSQTPGRDARPAGSGLPTRSAPTAATVDLACGGVPQQRQGEPGGVCAPADRLSPLSTHGPQRAQALCDLFWADTTSDVVAELQAQLDVAGCAVPDLPGWQLGVVLRLIVVAAAADDYAECRSVLTHGWLSLRRQAPAGLPLPERVLSGQQYVRLRSALTRAGLYDQVLQHVRWYRQARPVFRKRRNSQAPQDLADEMVALFDFPGLYRLLESCPQVSAAPASGAGRARGYPAVLLFGLAVCARYTSTQVSVARRLTSDGGQLYQRIVTTMTRRAAELAFPLPPSLPDVPPSKHQIRGFYESLVSRGLVQDLCRALPAVAVRQAQLQGNLLPGSQPDWSVPNLFQTIHADGMFLKPFADPRPDDADYLLREQARQDAARQGRSLEGDLLADEPRRRIQSRHTNGTEDGKQRHGINFLACHTRTEHGRITLAVDEATASEVRGAEPMLKQVLAAADGGVHTIAYDRIFQGKLLDGFLSNHGVLFANSNVAPKSNNKDGDGDGEGEGEQARSGQTTPPARTTTGQGGAGRAGRSAPRRKSGPTLSQQARREIEQMVLRQLAEEGLDEPTQPHFHTRFDTLLRQHFTVAARHQPVQIGTMFYDTSSGNVEVVRSKAFRYGAISHRGSDGSACQHELYADDGALFTVVPDPDPDTESDLPVKHTALRCISATLDPDSRTGRPRVRSRWLLDCPNGEHIEDVLWIPDPDKGAVGKAPREQAIASLRPLNRTNPSMYWLIAGRREDAEASHSQYQLHALPREGRAASLNPDQQLLDYLAHALTVNASTFQRFRQDGTN